MAASLASPSVGSNRAVVTAVAEAAPTNGEEPAAVESITGTAQEGKGARSQFRSWVTDPSRGYRQLTDEVHNRLVVQFDDRPPQTVRRALHEAGFHFQTDYLGLKDAWVRRNNFEGRVQLDAIKKLLREVEPGTPTPDR